MQRLKSLWLYDECANFDDFESFAKKLLLIVIF